jgi:hypothetical protein
MKKVCLILALVTIGLPLAPGTALADEPVQPYVYAMVKCSSLSIDQVVLAEQQFDTQYGYDHQLATPEMWTGTYISRVNEFAHTVGCPQVLEDDGSPAGHLTFWFKIYVPTYQRILRNLPQ